MNVLVNRLCSDATLVSVSECTIFRTTTQIDLIVRLGTSEALMHIHFTSVTPSISWINTV